MSRKYVLLCHTCTAIRDNAYYYVTIMIYDSCSPMLLIIRIIFLHFRLRRSKSINFLSMCFQVFAWKIADEMLHQKRNMESCYFAAQTMRTKIQLSFHELPQEAYTSLRDSLMEHISQINEHTNSAIVTQVCTLKFLSLVYNFCILLVYFCN